MALGLKIISTCKEHFLVLYIGPATKKCALQKSEWWDRQKAYLKFLRPVHLGVSAYIYHCLPYLTWCAYIPHWVPIVVLQPNIIHLPRKFIGDRSRPLHIKKAYLIGRALGTGGFYGDRWGWRGWMTGRNEDLLWYMASLTFSHEHMDLVEIGVLQTFLW